ncbi:sodium/hydrogen exchanger 8-like isoform X2 [Zingiber officinale]|uniref:sodium/hydrogen exchanger 8-like isoform X2 n=1 Tax=Zingiber officinale TaxID=94328 RepID=UPI001C4DCC87|nr:sodium/hydrogen exchanger 8-like isoform X2 [Zingiber officinale]
MAAVAEVPAPHDSGSLNQNEGPSPDDAVIFFGISLLLGIASRHLLNGTRVPYTVALLILGIGLGSIEYGTNIDLGKLGSGIRLWANINPNLLLSVFLPALLFESSFLLEVHQIKKCMMQMLLLAGPGVLISTFCLGAAVKVTFPYGWDWKTSLLLGGLLSATDPVAVVALLKELGASKKMKTIIEGESLMNDGTAIVVFQLFYQIVMGQSFNVGEIIEFISKVSLEAVAMGLAFGIASVIWLGFIFNDTVIEITLTLAVSYIAFFMAQDGANISGVLAVMTLGMFFAAFARTAFKSDSQRSLHHFWEMVTYIANTLIFILSGVVIADAIFHNESHFERHGSSWGYVMLLYVYLQLSRIIVVGCLYPFLQYFGYGITWKESIILIWSGLRGTVALALSLSVKRNSDNLNQTILTQELGILFLFFTGGVVFLTLIVNGSTVQFLLHCLGMDKLSTEKIRVLNFAKYEMRNKALESFSDLRDDEELGPADWPTIIKHITCLNNSNEGQIHPHNVGEGVQAAYWGMLDEGRITQFTANLLMQSVDEAMDLVASAPLSDWKGLNSSVHFPKYYRFLHMRRLPRRVVTYFTVERLESACYICAAFLRAHSIARRQLHDFLGESAIATAVIDESNEEGEEALKFLEDVRLAFPQVLRVVKTRQVTYSILKHLSEYVKNLEQVGLLEEKETFYLYDALQTDLKKLLRNPPMVKMPKISELLSSHPLLGALPSSFHEPLENSTKETIKLHGENLYKEGLKPTGIWLISIGVVKWTSKKLANEHALHPTFSHGTTLGLYEVLIGKPYICDMVTDSVVHCFFINSEKILSLLRSDSAIEDFLWQESVIVVAKTILPQIFEKMTMQELRNLIAERSSMNIYIRGVIEIRPRSVGFLLDGFLKTQDSTEQLIASPAALLPLHMEQSFIGLESSGMNNLSFCHAASGYQVETRARVIFFDLAVPETEASLSKRSTSWISLPGQPQRTLSKEHAGLLSWPENLFKGRGDHQNPKESDKQTTSLPAYGSLANIPSSYCRNDPMGSSVNRSYSLSYPRLPLRSVNDTRTLVSVQSESSSLKNSLAPAGSASRLGTDPPLPIRKDGEDNSSDESGGEEVIIRIDSLSNLFFCQTSETSNAQNR